MTTPTLGGWMVHVMRQSDGALSLEEALHVLMDSMKQYFPCQSVAVILIDDDTKELRIKISRQISYTFVKHFHRSSPSATAEQVVLEQRTLLLNDLDPESEIYKQLKLEHDFSSAVLAPIIRTQRGIGYIFADRANHEKFDEADLLHLQVIGYLVGNLIEKFDLIRQSKKLSQIDDATQALQYKAFVPAAATEMERARTHGYPIALALVSVDAFRKYVDTYGIDAAHALLADVVRILREHIRDMDTLGRFGADEFILCLSGATAEEAQAKLERMRDAVAEQSIGRGDTAATLTIGAVTLKTERDLTRSLQDILAALGKSLVKAKNAGPGHIVIGSPEG